ncbi:MAG: translation initiation factor IF-2 [Verrucomicrobia bacterium]|nr:translation initiation factor IF-2 [Verrucomicrobiota bacterium]
MPVRIYDIAKRLGIPNKVVLQKAKELGIKEARAASCSLDKITAEFLEQQLAAKPEPAPVPETAASPVAEPVKADEKQVEEKPAAKETSKKAKETKTEPKAEEPAETPSQPKAEEKAPVEKQPRPMEKAVREEVPESVIREVESFVSKGLEELSAETDETPRFTRGSKRENDSQKKAHSESASAKENSHQKSKGQKEESTKTAKHHEQEPVKESAPAASEAQAPAAPKPAPVFGLKPIWKIPLSAIGKRFADEKAAIEAAENAKKAAEEAKQVEQPKLGQKIGFIQLPQKPAPAAKQPEKQAGKGRDKREKEKDRGKDKGQQRSNQQQPQQRPAAQQRPGSQQASSPRTGTFQQSRQPGGRQPGEKDLGKGSRTSGKQQFTDRKAPAPLQTSASSADLVAKLPSHAEVITMKAPVVVRQLAELLNRKPFQLIADLMELGVFANVNQSIDENAARRLCAKHGFRFELEKREKGGALVKGDQKKIEIVDEEDKPEDLKPRPPVVTIMGHVDHGKTTLLDAIRKSNVASGEAGGITQHIGAYTISIPHPERKGELQQITFLDTPGHEAFSAMRARGANVTDIVILVVAANDGVMPQTVEAIRHAQAAKVTIIVAVNKCDHPAANPLKARQQLQDYGLLCEEWGGETIFVDVSALTKKGVDDLLGMLVLQAEMLELKANPNRKAKGNVVESGLAPGGPTATVLVRKGTLKLGDAILCGEFYGKARALINEEGQRLKQASPSEAVKLLGLNGVPEAGTEFQVVENEKIAREMAEEQRQRNRDEGNRDRERPVTLEGFLENFGNDVAKVLKIVVKADTQGSVEAIVDALKKIESEKVSLEIIHSAVGTITESDVLLASASKAVVIGFHTRVDSSATEAARREAVQIKLYSIIYELIDQVRDAMAGLLDPIINEVPQGQAEVRQVFNLSKAGSVAGCMVTQGRVIKGRCRVIRGKETIFEGSFQSLRRFQDEVNELKAGMECGIRIDGFHDYKEGDIIQSYSIEKIAQQL